MKNNIFEFDKRKIEKSEIIEHVRYYIEKSEEVLNFYQKEIKERH